MKIVTILRHIVRNALAYALLSSLVFVVALHYFGLPKMTSVTIQRLPNEQPRRIFLPHEMPDSYNHFIVPENSPNNYIFTISIDYKPYQQTQFVAYPTGCVEDITLNGKNVPVDSSRNCNRDIGFVVDLTGMLNEGSNELKIHISNTQHFHWSNWWDTAGYGLYIGPVFFGFNTIGLSGYISSLLVASVCIALTLFLRRFTGEPLSGVILSGGLLMYLRQLRLTSCMNYTIDMPSHFEYICFIINHGFPPGPGGGWEYYHPPLYYQIEAAIARWCNWFGSFEPVTVMRLFSVACFMVFLLFSTLMLNRLIRNRLAYYAALIMLVFYPSGVFNAPRLDSHLLLYSFFAGCLYFLMRWVEEGKINNFWLALICFGLGIGTRSNALALVPIIGVAALYQIYTKHLTMKHLFSVGMMVSLCVIAVGCIQNFGRTAHYRETAHSNSNYVIGNSDSVQSNQRVSNSAEHLLFLNTQLLFNPPFTDWWGDQTGRQYFWNGVLKTSLTEHFWLRAWGTAQKVLALLLASIGYVFVSRCWMRVDKRKEWYMCAISLVISLAMLMLNRIYHPFAPSQDFRYIYPSLVSFCGLIGLVIEQHLTRRHYISAVAGVMIVVWFSWSAVNMVLAG